MSFIKLLITFSFEIELLLQYVKKAIVNETMHVSQSVVYS